MGPPRGSGQRLGVSPKGGLLRFAGMAGSSIASPDAAPWITDFLNAAYFRRSDVERDVDDLRTAFSVLTTYWYQKAWSRRLHLTDLPAFHRAYGAHRFGGARASLGLLTREQLFAGASELVGYDFGEAYLDGGRRGWGVSFATVAEREAYDPSRRMRLARLGPLTPERAPPQEQVWDIFEPVRMPSAEGVIRALNRPETWPDYASETGRFTPLRPGGLLNQSFEIEVAAGTSVGWPVFTRGYVTLTRLVSTEEPEALAGWLSELEAGLARQDPREPRAVPDGGTALLGFDLTTHQGHFMGHGHNRILLFTHQDAAWVRTAGTWDPMPWHLDRAYRLAGQETQRAFWGEGGVPALSMLHQLARAVAAQQGG